MKTALKMFLALTLISVLSGALLAAMDSYTAPRIQDNFYRDLIEAITLVLPKYDRYEEVNTNQYPIYVGKQEDLDDPVGLAFKVTGNGFQGKISIMIGVTPDFSHLTAIKILEQIETPGLGTKIVIDPSNKKDPYWFANQFKDLKLEPYIKLVKNVKPKNDNEIQAITGATISSKAVVRILNERIKEVEEAYRKQLSVKTD
ncbi:FMN-binding protein [bacterium]|nr:FMN-binding protein [bacterium]